MDTTLMYEVHKVILSNHGRLSFFDDKYILQLLLILLQCPSQLQPMKTALVAGFSTPNYVEVWLVFYGRFP